MGRTMDQPQESRTEKVAIAVTKTEKAAVRAITAIRGTDESNLCRTTPISEILAEFQKLRRVDAPEPVEAAEKAAQRARERVLAGEGGVS